MAHLEEPLLTDAEAAAELGVKPLTMPAWRTRGEGPEYIRIGRLIRYTPSALRKYVASRVVRPEASS
jgi:hypothetical protein